MNRTKAALVAIVLVLVIGGLYSNCGQPGQFKFHDVIATNPMGPTRSAATILSAVCTVLTQCNNQVSLSNCISGIEGTSGLATSLGLPASYGAYSSIESAEQGGAITGASAPTQTCVAQISSLTCSDPAVQAAYNPAASAPYSGVANMIPVQSGSCPNVFSPPRQMIVVGGFTTFNGAVAHGVARVNSDGSVDSSFNSAVGAQASTDVRQAVVLANHQILIGGDFTTYNGTSAPMVARLNTDGTLDGVFHSPLASPDPLIKNLVLWSGGKILVSHGAFKYDGVNTNGVTSISADGTVDGSFNAGGTGADDNVYTTVVQPDGKILIGGRFTHYNGVAAGRIARLNADGTLDTTFNAGGAGFDGTIWEGGIALQTDGKIVVGGGFSTYNSQTVNKLVRLNVDGTVDATFNPGTGANTTVDQVKIQTDGKILAAGNFTTYAGVSAGHVVRLNANGSPDSTFNVGSGANGNIIGLVVQPNDGKILLGGDGTFSSFNGTAVGNLVRLNSDGSIDTGFNVGAGANSSVYDFVFLP